MFDNALQVLSEREWILTNEIGGYSLGFGNLANKRKYNGLLIASTNPTRRDHILSCIEERVEDGSTHFFLDTNHYLNCMYPNGFENLVKAWLRPYPCFLYSTSPTNNNYLIFKELFLIKHKNAIAIKYTNFGKKDLQLILKPKFTMRDHHFVNSPGTWEMIYVEKEIQDKAFKIKRTDNGMEAFGYIDEGNIIEDYSVYRSVYYPIEAVRGYDASEDLMSPVRMILPLKRGESRYLVFSTSSLDDPIKEAVRSESYYKKFPLPRNHPSNQPPSELLNVEITRKNEFDLSGYKKILEMAARDFILDNDDIIAGYPWFGAWGRDTLISLGGIEYLSDGKEIGTRILRKYGKQIHRGLLPNTFGEGAMGLNYDSVDAPLWYVLRCYQLAPDDKELFGYVSNIVLNYINEVTHPFFVADDGLVEIREGNYAITWMDAKIYDTPVTPRWGKPIEINGLWYNALCAIKEMAKRNNIKVIEAGAYKCTTDDLDKLITQVKDSLQKFVAPVYLADRIYHDNPIWEIRPNAVIALSLPFDFVGQEIMEKVWRSAKDNLLTHYGLRSLDPKHSAFKQKYLGNQKQRDMAYHQGTVWTFLIAPFAKLSWKVLKDTKKKDEIAKEISGYIWAFRDAIMKGEMASIAEIWDGLDPYFPKGCTAQAWSVFALTEIEQLLSSMGGN